MTTYDIWVYLKEQPFPGLVRNKNFIAYDPQIENDLLVIRPVDVSQPTSIFPMENVIYWTGKEISLDQDAQQDDEDQAS